MSRDGHRGRPWGLYAAVVVTLLAGMVIISQLATATHRHEPGQPTPAGTILPVPLWTPPASHGAESHAPGTGAQIYLSIPNPAG